jgi:hypothetical protein
MYTSFETTSEFEGAVKPNGNIRAVNKDMYSIIGIVTAIL